MNEKRDRENAIELVERTLGLKGPFSTEVLAGGCSGSEVIRVQDYVVRFWNMQWVDYFPQDLACQLIASEAGYGPEVYFSDPGAGITIMQYHLPEPLEENRLETLVDLLKKIHTGPVVPKGIDRATYLDLLIEENKGVDLEAIRAIKNEVFAATRPTASCVPCHRDLHHGNLIYSQGRFWAIDFTWGALDDPYVDLANIAVFNCDSFEEETHLLQLYLGRTPSIDEMARLALLKLPVKIFYGLEFLGIASTHAVTQHSQGPQSYKSFGQHPSVALSSADFRVYGDALLKEVREYALGTEYERNLNLAAGAARMSGQA